MDTSTPFKWRHFQAEIILLCVRWYLRYPLSYRNLEEMMLEQDHHFFKRLVKLGMGFFSFLSVFCNTTTWSLGNPD